MKAILTIGVSASGKSTWADEFVKANPSYQKIERDCIRKGIMFQKGYDGLDWSKWKFQWEKDVTREHERLIDVAIQNGRDIVVSDTNLNPKTRASLTRRFKEAGYEVEERMFPISYEEAVTRDSRRRYGVGPSVIAQQMESWDKQFSKTYVPDTTKPQALILDLDGTIAHHDGKRDIYDTAAAINDRCDSEVKAIVNGLHHQGWYIIVLTGRKAAHKQASLDWLKKNRIPFFEFHCRPEGDEERHDDEVKLDVFWRDIAPRYNVRAVIEDRPRVCRAWRSIGLKTFQVGNPHKEF